jgi:hypothetical protein
VPGLKFKFAEQLHSGRAGAELLPESVKGTTTLQLPAVRVACNSAYVTPPTKNQYFFSFVVFFPSSSVFLD